MHQLLDFHVLDAPQLISADLLTGKFGTRLADLLRAKQTAGMVGLERWLRPQHHVTPIATQLFFSKAFGRYIVAPVTEAEIQLVAH
ncbi:MAG: hypothetical protein MZV49_22140 [Rhodopseudomonas palustris]|nr:hypothetical protein [Rhodopseudomonas palustris]